MKRLTKSQEIRANALRDRGMPAEWAILAALNTRGDTVELPPLDPRRHMAGWISGAFFWNDSRQGYEFWATAVSAISREEYQK